MLFTIFRVKEQPKKSDLCLPFASCCVSHLPYPEDGGNNFLRNVGKLLQDYTLVIAMRTSNAACPPLVLIQKLCPRTDGSGHESHKGHRYGVKERTRLMLQILGLRARRAQLRKRNGKKKRTHSASCTEGNGDSFTPAKRPGREADHYATSSAQVKNGALSPLPHTSP
jgi:hypothetical protein